MVDHSEIRNLSPFVSFLSARLRASLSSSSDHRPQVRDFALGDSSLGLVVGACILCCANL